jgi:hypothetical protein
MPAICLYPQVDALWIDGHFHPVYTLKLAVFLDIYQVIAENQRIFILWVQLAATFHNIVQKPICLLSSCAVQLHFLYAMQVCLKTPMLIFEYLQFGLAVVCDFRFDSHLQTVLSRFI